MQTLTFFTILVGRTPCFLPNSIIPSKRSIVSISIFIIIFRFSKQIPIIISRCHQSHCFLFAGFNIRSLVACLDIMNNIPSIIQFFFTISKTPWYRKGCHLFTNFRISRCKNYIHRWRRLFSLHSSKKIFINPQLTFRMLH